MLTVRFLKTDISISFGFLFLTALNCASPQSLTLFCLMFCLMHELAHLAFMLLFRLKISEICFYGGGIRISSCGLNELSVFKKILIYSAGCLFNFIAGFVFWLADHRTAGAVNMFIGIFNLLPVEYFDGGKILFCLFPESERILGVISKITAVLMTVFVLSAAFFTSSAPSLSETLTICFIVIAELSE